MLKCFLVRSARSPWSWDQDRWTCRESWVEPFPHAALESVAATDGHNTFITVRERLSSMSSPAHPDRSPHALSPQEYRKALSEAASWPLEHLTIEATGDHRFLLRAGHWGSAPIYLAILPDAVFASWNIVDLRAYLSDDNLDEYALALRLRRLQGYTSRTLFHNVVVLTERVLAVLDASGFHLHYPPSAPHFAPRPVHAGADVVGVYESILGTSLSRWKVPWEHTAIEVSGGLDSANVAVSAASVAERAIVTYGLLLGGQAGGQQERRRAEFVRPRSFLDYTVHALQWPPWCPHGRRGMGDTFNPSEEPYSEAIEAALDQLASPGSTVILTGIGGDELMSLRPWEASRGETDKTDKARTHFDGSPFFTPKARAIHNDVSGLPLDDAPEPIISGQSLLAAACRASVFLRKGCWPINPLCTPELIRFCEWLPAEWRRDRTLQRARLLRAGMSREWVCPQLREDFAHIMQAGLRRNGLSLARHLFHDSILADFGLIDPLRLARELDVYDGTATRIIDEAFYEVITLELALRRLLGHAEPVAR